MDEMQMGSARATISNVIATYNNCGDRGMIDGLLAVFAADAVFEVPEHRMEGRDAIRAYLLGIVERSQSTTSPDEKSTSATSRLFGSRHHLTTSRIEFVSPGEATAWTYFYVMRQGVIFQEGVYIDRFQKTHESWQIAHRRVKMLWVDNRDS
jgi:ketosteroid isomerase-like protein